MRIIVADASPRIGLASADMLHLLPELFAAVLIPEAVREELKVDSARPGARRLARAIEESWLQVCTAPAPRHQIPVVLDAGEHAAINLAVDRNCLLLIDDSRGRNVAGKQGIAIIGTGRVLLEARKRNLIDSVAQALARLQETGYRLSAALHARLLELAGES